MPASNVAATARGVRPLSAIRFLAYPLDESGADNGRRQKILREAACWSEVSRLRWI
jgi:hypothetical protein